MYVLVVQASNETGGLQKYVYQQPLFEFSGDSNDDILSSCDPAADCPGTFTK